MESQGISRTQTIFKKKHNYIGTTIKDTWAKPRGRVEAGEGGGFGWGGVEGWGENADKCHWTTIKKKGEGVFAETHPAADTASSSCLCWTLYSHDYFVTTNSYFLISSPFSSSPSNLPLMLPTCFLMSLLSIEKEASRGPSAQRTKWCNHRNNPPVQGLSQRTLILVQCKLCHLVGL